jgi:hypothetical protein
MNSPRISAGWNHDPHAYKFRRSAPGPRFVEDEPPLMVQIAYGAVIVGAFGSLLLFIFGF